MTYTFDDLPEGPSGTASIDVDVPTLVQSTDRPAGYINVVTDSGWVTQNLPILPGYPYPSISTTLTLGNAYGGGIVSSMVAGVCYSTEPYVDAPPVTNDVFAVGATEFNGQGIGQPVVAAPAPPPVGAVGFAFPGVLAFSVQAGHTNVEAANNQCAPAAVANGLDWLRATYGTAVPHANVIGLNGVPANSLVGQLDVKMGRVIANRAAGRGVNLTQKTAGLMDYLWTSGIRNLTLRHQGRSPFPGDVFTGGVNINWPNVVNPLNSAGQGVWVQPNFIFNEIARGAAVQLGTPVHAVTVIGAGSILNAPFMLYVSDHAQTRRNGVGFINDNVGTTRIDFSFLVPQPNNQPLIRYGSENGRRPVNVLTQRP